MIKKRFRKVPIIAAALLVTLIGGYAALLRIDKVSAPTYNVNKTPFSITIPMNRLVLIRSGEHIGAFKIVRLASRGGLINGAKYEYWYCEDGKHALAIGSCKHGFGYVFERYNTTGKTKTGVTVEDAGSELNIKAGRLWVAWSSGNHIYTQPNRQEGERPVTDIPEITATPWSAVSEVDLSSPGLKWISAAMSTNAVTERLTGNIDDATRPQAELQVISN